MSSRSHQTYTRKWATNLNVPIFSIDYRLSPEYPYPCALDDVWQAYNWIINYAPRYFSILCTTTLIDIVPQRVVLVGDSAGGNLIAALTLLCIKERVRVPDGLLMAYPALNLSVTEFTPSMLISLNDGCIIYI
jgi:hormone-sensitive lipase